MVDRKLSKSCGTAKTNSGTLNETVTVGTFVLDVINPSIGRPEVGGGRPPRLLGHAAHLRVGVVRRRATLIKRRLDLKIKGIVS